MGDIRYALRNLLRRPTFTLIGMVLGLAGSWALTRFIGKLLVGVQPGGAALRVTRI